MDKGNPRLGFCLCGRPATIRDTKAEDGRLHFSCHDLTPEGKAKHYGFVDRSEVGRLEGAEMETDVESEPKRRSGWVGIAGWGDTCWQPAKVGHFVKERSGDVAVL